MSNTAEEGWLKQVGRWNPKVIPSLDQGKKYHVFLAYADIDEDIEFALKVYKALKTLGFNAYFYQEDALMGSNVVEAVHDAMESSLRVVAIQTPNALGKVDQTERAALEFKFKLHATQCRMMTEGRVLIIPILKDTTERDIPLSAKYGNFVDCTRQPDSWFKELCDLIVADGVFLGDVCPITNIGEGAAWSYINGYLKVILPYLKENIQSWCIKTSIDRPCPIPFNQVSFKFHAVIPESGRLCSKFSEADKHIRDIEGMTVAERNWAGDVGRKYTTSIHSVTDSDGKCYYFAGEFTSIIKSMHETMQNSLTTLNTGNFQQQVIKLSNTLELLSNYRQTRPLADALQITRYTDQGEDEQKLSNILLEKIKAEIQDRSEEEVMEV